MLLVRIQGQELGVNNETLDRLFGIDSWRRVGTGLLRQRIRAHHAGGRLVIDGKRLRFASPLEEAESRLRSADSRDEILRWGFLRIASGLAQIADEIGALPIATTTQDLQEPEARRHSARAGAAEDFDSRSANEKLTRDESENLAEDPSTVRDNPS